MAVDIQIRTQNGLQSIRNMKSFKLIDVRDIQYNDQRTSSGSGSINETKVTYNVPLSDFTDFNGKDFIIFSKLIPNWHRQNGVTYRNDDASLQGISRITKSNSGQIILSSTYIVNRINVWCFNNNNSNMFTYNVNVSIYIMEL